MFDILSTQGFDLNMDSEEIKADTETYRNVERKIMLGGLDSQFKKTHHPGSSKCLSNRIKHGMRTIVYS